MSTLQCFLTGENVQVECPLEGKQGYSLYPRLRYIHEVSLQHGKPMDDKPLLARRSEAVKNMSKELSTLFEANGLEPYRCIVKEGSIAAFVHGQATMVAKLPVPHPMIYVRLCKRVRKGFQRPVPVCVLFRSHHGGLPTGGGYNEAKG